MFRFAQKGSNSEQLLCPNVTIGSTCLRLWPRGPVQPSLVASPGAAFWEVHVGLHDDLARLAGQQHASDGTLSVTDCDPIVRPHPVVSEEGNARLQLEAHARALPELVAVEVTLGLTHENPVVDPIWQRAVEKQRGRWSGYHRCPAKIAAVCQRAAVQDRPRPVLDEDGRPVASDLLEADGQEGNVRSAGGRQEAELAMTTFNVKPDAPLDQVRRSGGQPDDAR